MEIHRFSPEAQELASLEMRLADGDLTLDQLRDIEDQVVFRVTDKTRDAAQNIFTQIEAKKKSLLQRQIEPLELKQDVISKIAKFQLIRSGLDADESDEAMEGLQREVALVDDPKVQALAEEKLGEVSFRREYPIAEELDPASFDSNFAFRVSQVSKKIAESNSLALFQNMFNATQQREILRFVKGDHS